MNDLKQQLATILHFHVRVAEEVYTDVWPSDEQLERVIAAVKQHAEREQGGTVETSES